MAVVFVRQMINNYKQQWMFDENFTIEAIRVIWLLLLHLSPTVPPEFIVRIMKMLMYRHLR